MFLKVGARGMDFGDSKPDHTPETRKCKDGLQGSGIEGEHLSSAKG